MKGNQGARTTAPPAPPQPKEPTLCINCEHHAVVATHHHHCLAYIDLVTGEHGEAMCWEMRRANEACGPGGKLFTLRAV